MVPWGGQRFFCRCLPLLQGRQWPLGLSCFVDFSVGPQKLYALTPCRQLASREYGGLLAYRVPSGSRFTSRSLCCAGYAPSLVERFALSLGLSVSVFKRRFCPWASVFLAGSLATRFTLSGRCFALQVVGFLASFLATRNLCFLLAVIGRLKPTSFLCGLFGLAEFLFPPCRFSAAQSPLLFLVGSLVLWDFFFLFVAFQPLEVRFLSL